MELEITYKVPNRFTMGELRAIVSQSEVLPDDADVRLYGELAVDGPASDGDGHDAIVIKWNEA